jgi:hypothetical protein
MKNIQNILKNPKVQKGVMVVAGAAAAYYGGPAARDAAYEYLPKIAQALGLQ